MEVELKNIAANARPILENLFSYYIYDMSEYMGWGPDSQGRYAGLPHNLDLYWQDRHHHPYFIYADHELAGFVLVRHYPGRPAVLDIDQFFVLRRFKRKGVGKQTLLQVVTQHPGEWQIRVLKENQGAFRFWQVAVTSIVGAAFDITSELDVDLEMNFIRFHSAGSSLSIQHDAADF